MTAQVRPLFPDMAAKPARNQYSEDFEDLWKVMRNHMRRGKTLLCKAATAIEYEKCCKLGHDNTVLAQCVMAYGRQCRETGLSPCDPHRFLRPGRTNGPNFEDFLPDAEDTPESAPVAARSRLTGEIAQQWQWVCARLTASDGAAARAWLPKLTLVAIDGQNRLVFEAENAFAKRYLTDNGWPQRIRNVWGREVVVR